MKKTERIKVSELRKMKKESNSENFTDLEWVKVVVTELDSDEDIRKVDFYSELDADNSELNVKKLIATMKIKVDEQSTTIIQSSINNEDLPNLFMSLLQSLYVL